MTVREHEGVARRPEITITVHAMDQCGQRLNDRRRWCDLEVEIIKQVRFAEGAGKYPEPQA